jgi:hypothetical protein
MTVEFYYPPQYLIERKAVQFDASVDGELISCVISEEDLRRLVGSSSGQGAEAILNAFNQHREAIERAARSLLQRQGLPEVDENGRRELLITAPGTDVPTVD